jgi:hypothetical protein
MAIGTAAIIANPELLKQIEQQERMQQQGRY